MTGKELKDLANSIHDDEIVVGAVLTAKEFAKMYEMSYYDACKLFNNINPEWAKESIIIDAYNLIGEV